MHYSPNRSDRRKERIRRALIDAARRLIAEGAAGTASIAEITAAADVGFGTFYNHFDDKPSLFRAAATDVLEEWGQVLSEVTAELSDIAEVFTASFRISGRLFLAHPELAKVVDKVGFEILDIPIGLAPRALKDLESAREAARFEIIDPTMALSTVTGALLGLLHLWIRNPDSVDAETVDHLAATMLRAFGVNDGEISTLIAKELPVIRSST